jgi:hypothetical protein
MALVFFHLDWIESSLRALKIKWRTRGFIGGGDYTCAAVINTEHVLLKISKTRWFFTVAVIFFLFLLFFICNVLLYTQNT